MSYFRITAFHPETNISLIADSNGKFSMIWEFSAYLIQKGFKIIEVNNETNFGDGDLPKISEDREHILIRACGQGQPVIQHNMIAVNKKTYISYKRK